MRGWTVSERFYVRSKLNIMSSTIAQYQEDQEFWDCTEQCDFLFYIPNLIITLDRINL